MEFNKLLSPYSQINWFAVPTKDRPRNLYKCLSSYLKNARAFSRNVSVLVSDDSVLKESVQENKDVIDAIKRRFGVRVFYSGLTEKRLLAKVLANQIGISETITEFAILGPENSVGTYGANRNSIVLNTVGHAIFSADDDTLCYLRSNSSLNSNIAATIGDSLPHRFYKSRKDAMHSLKRTHIDLLGVHESYLGKNLTELLPFESAQSELTLEPPRGKIKIVNNGVVGDSGYVSSAGIALNIGNSAAPRLDTEMNYRTCITSREIVRQVDSLQIGPTHQFMATAYSFVNDGCIPPFFPNCRNEDGILAYFISISMPEVHIANLPLSIVHAANPNRKYINSFFQFRFSELLIALLQHWKIRNNDPQRSLSDFGLSLIDAANLSNQELSSMLHDIITDLMRVKIDYLISLLISRNFFPEYWAEDIRRQILFIERFIADQINFFSRIIEVPNAKNPINEIANGLKIYGFLLHTWPLMCEASKNISLLD